MLRTARLVHSKNLTDEVAGRIRRFAQNLARLAAQKANKRRISPRGRGTHVPSVGVPLLYPLCGKGRIYSANLAAETSADFAIYQVILFVAGQNWM
jgi:hypothetical protein